MSRAVAPPGQVAAVLPLKPLRRAKSRLGPLSEAARMDLVLSFALDTVNALGEVVGPGSIMVITDDVAAAATFHSLGCHVIPDGVTDDLNESLRLAAAEITRRLGPCGLLGLLPDVPCLNADAVVRALRACQGADLAVIPDHLDVGITAFYSRELGCFTPCFGQDSLEAALALGATSVGQDLTRARLDVDTLADLDNALAVGVGKATQAAARRHGLSPLPA